MRRLTAGLILMLSLAACTSQPQASAPTADPATFSRRLATVVLPPTPDDAQRRATQLAARPTATFQAPTLAITPTVYVGTFIGVEADEPSLPVVDPALFQNLPGAPTPVASNLDACRVAADPAFGGRWAEQAELSAQLGCAMEAAVQAQGSVQAFERGTMLFVPAGDIWAIQASAAGGPYWRVAQAPPDQEWTGGSAPDGLQVPTLGFGTVWKANEAVREALGFARADEAGSLITLQRFERGALLRDGASGATWVLIGGPEFGVAYGPY